MSLINLASKTNNDIIDQQPFNFKNHFPQPIVVKPNSQVCLTHFYHFRDDGYYRITSQNNVIGYMIANFRNNSDYRYATLNSGRYTGTELALEIARAMNSVILQENYNWQCVFTDANPLANPPELDKFVITYTNVTTPATTTGGEWEKLINSGNTTTATIVNDNAVSGVSKIKNPSFTPTDFATAILDKGILLHEGIFRVKGLSFSGDGTTFSEDMRPTECKIGLIRHSFSSANNNNVNNSFKNTNGDILIDIVNNGSYEIIISNLQQRQGSSSIDAPNGKIQIERRVINATNLAGMFDETHLFGFEIFRTSATTQNGHDFVIRMIKSTDGGASYVAITDGTGGNGADGRPLIYSQTINSVAYTSLIYTTRGIPDGSGGVVLNPINNKSTATINRAIVKYAPFLPFVSIEGDQSKITGVDLANEKFTLQTFVENSGNTGTGGNVVADNVFTMEFREYTGANGYDWRWIVESAETTPFVDLGSNDIHAYKFKQHTDDVLAFDVYADGNTPIATATIIGTLTYDPYDANGVGSFSLTITALPIDPVGFKGEAVCQPTNEVIELECDGKFNSFGNKPTLFDGSVALAKHGQSNHNELQHTELTLGGESGDGLGVALQMASQILLGRLQQADIDDNDANPPRLDTNTAGGSLGATIGFGENVITNNRTTFDYTSDIAPIKIAGDDTLHISIPELTNVKSQEGETSNIGKTIKVVPKSVFNVNDDNGALSYNSPYEDWIDINNGEDLELNELTIQIRKPDMTLATSLQPTTRATIKIRENPDRLREKANNDMLTKMSQLMTQSQNTDQNLVVKYTGS